MRFHMVGKHIPSGTEIEWYRMRVRPDVAPLVLGRTIHIDFIEGSSQNTFRTKGTAGTHFKCSTKTKDPVLAESRRVQIHAFLNTYYDSVLAGHVTVSNRKLTELAGNVYRKLIEINSDDPGSVDIWQTVKAWNRAVDEGRVTNPPGLDIFGGPKEDEKTALVVFGVDLTAGVDALTPGSDNREPMERRFGDAATWVLSEQKLEIDEATRRKLLVAVQQAVTHAAMQLKKNARFDYSPDPNAANYPVPEKKRELFTVDMLSDLWKRGGKTQRMIRNMDPIVSSFKQIVGQKDIREIDKKDVAKWRTYLIEKTDKSEETINKSSIHNMTTLFNVAIRDGIITGSNVLVGTKTSLQKGSKPKRERYTDDEVKEILKIARCQHDHLARRWIPWICACTGARVGEVAQMYKSDDVEKDCSVKKDADGIYYIDFKPDPTIKKDKLKTDFSTRCVPVHSILVEEGFLDFWDSLKSGPLFYDLGRKTAKNDAHELVVSGMSQWIRRNGFVNKLKSPNYGFRLWFRTAAPAAGVPIEFSRYMIGHRQGTVEAGYVAPSVGQLKPEIEKVKIPVPD